MQVTIDLDPSVYQALESQARAERTTLGGVIGNMLSAIVPGNQPVSVQTTTDLDLTNGELSYQIPVSKGLRPFSAEDVARLEEADDLR
jgi:hypothetical protein